MNMRPGTFSMLANLSLLTTTHCNRITPSGPKKSNESLSLPYNLIIVSILQWPRQSVIFMKYFARTRYCLLVGSKQRMHERNLLPMNTTYIDANDINGIEGNRKCNVKNE